MRIFQCCCDVVFELRAQEYENASTQRPTSTHLQLSMHMSPTRHNSALVSFETTYDWRPRTGTSLQISLRTHSVRLQLIHNKILQIIFKRSQKYIIPYDTITVDDQLLTQLLNECKNTNIMPDITLFRCYNS